MKRLKYFASVYPSTSETGEYEQTGGYGKFSDYSNNLKSLVRNTKRLVRNTLLSEYPVVIDIRDNISLNGKTVQRWRLHKMGGRFAKIEV